MRALTGKLLSSDEDRTRYLAQEIHDNFSQQIAAASMELARLIEDSQAVTIRKRLRALQERLSGVAQEMGRLAHRLHPAAVEILGLPSALRTEATEFSAREGIKLSIGIRNVPPQLPREVALSLYRITQEALRNVSKHSKAKCASITLIGAQQRLRLRIRDNGVGFDQTASKERGALGLISIEERVRMIGGTVSIKSQPDKGVELTVDIPLNEGP